jgi:hypothetical protein
MNARLLLLSVFLSTSALAHDAPTGWSYPFNCCSNQDCREVPDASVKETPSGYLASNGETIPYADKRVKDSPDGKFHLCTIAGREDGRALCLFIPPRSF